MLALPHDEVLLEHNDLGMANSISTWEESYVLPCRHDVCKRPRVRLSKPLKPPLDDAPEGAPGPHESNGDFQS